MTIARAALGAALVSAAVAVVLAAGCTVPSAGPLPTDGPGLVAAVCTQCHNIQRVQAARKNRDGWARTVARMQTHGLKVNATQMQTIIEYLVQRDAGQ